MNLNIREPCSTDKGTKIKNNKIRKRKEFTFSLLVYIVVVERCTTILSSGTPPPPPPLSPLLFLLLFFFLPPFFLSLYFFHVLSLLIFFFPPLPSPSRAVAKGWEAPRFVCVNRLERICFFWVFFFCFFFSTRTLLCVVVVNANIIDSRENLDAVFCRWEIFYIDCYWFVFDEDQYLLYDCLQMRDERCKRITRMVGMCIRHGIIRWLFYTWNYEKSVTRINYSIVTCFPIED